jgi:hypothetical protein
MPLDPEPLPDDHDGVVEELQPPRHGVMCKQCGTVLASKHYRYAMTPAQMRAHGFKGEHPVMQEGMLCPTCRPKRQPVHAMSAKRLRQEHAKGNIRTSVFEAFHDPLKEEFGGNLKRAQQALHTAALRERARLRAPWLYVQAVVRGALAQNFVRLNTAQKKCDTVSHSGADEAAPASEATTINAVLSFLRMDNMLLKTLDLWVGQQVKLSAPSLLQMRANKTAQLREARLMRNGRDAYDILLKRSTPRSRTDITLTKDTQWVDLLAHALQLPGENPSLGKAQRAVNRAQEMWAKIPHAYKERSLSRPVPLLIDRSPERMCVLYGFDHDMLYALREKSNKVLALTDTMRERFAAHVRNTTSELDE